VGVVVDGCPPRLPLEAAEIQAELDRRRPGQSDLVTPRQEEDKIEILSGLFEGRTTGTPLDRFSNHPAWPDASFRGRVAVYSAACI
jgi:chorismate synthase